MSPDHVDGMVELTQRLDGFEAAHRELDAIDAEAGLDSASLLRPRRAEQAPTTPSWGPPVPEPEPLRRPHPAMSSRR